MMLLCGNVAIAVFPMVVGSALCLLPAVSRDMSDRLLRGS
jgi:hypothetical protein